MTPDFVKQKILEYRGSFEAFAKDCIKIKDHNTARILPMVLNRGQRILHNIAEKMKVSRGFVKIIFVKSRRFGGSTYVESRYYWLTALNFNRHTFIVGHEEESTNTLYSMATLMQEQNPIKPQTRKSNARELIFDTQSGDGLKCQYRLATARNVDAGRSQGIHYLHCSEEAYYLDGRTLLDGLLQCVPDPPAESEIFRESTANGFGNSFQEDVFKHFCEGKYVYYEEDGVPYAWYNPDTDWVVVFIPWFVHDLYTKPFDNNQLKEAFLKRLSEPAFNREDMKWEESEASALRKKYKLTLEQLHWREWAIENKCGGAIEKFRQEYPATLEEAFLSTGSNVFPKSLCDMAEKMCRPPALVGDIVDRLGKTKIRPNPHGHFAVWEKPNPEERYFITVDSAGGMKDSQEREGREPDPSCIDVWNHRTGHLAAQWHGNIEYDLIGDLVEMIGNMFNRCIACVELQNHGYTVVADLRRRTYPMFCHRPGEPGWMTTTKTKPQMVDGLYRMVRDGDMIIRCKETISEMRTFVEKDHKYNASKGCHDERVDTAGMASQMFIILPKVWRESRNEPKQSGIVNWLRQDRDTINKYHEVRVG